MNARLAAERVDHAARVVGEGGAAVASRRIGLMRAFSAKVLPVSTGSAGRARRPIRFEPKGASSSRISVSLPGLWVAITAGPVEWPAHVTANVCRPTSFSMPLRAGREQRQELISLNGFSRRWPAPRRSAVAGHHEVGVGLGFESSASSRSSRRIGEHAARHRGDLVAQHRASIMSRVFIRQAIGERDPGAGDRGGARAAVGLDHVAVDA